jgi:hypothetical protein
MPKACNVLTMSFALMPVSWLTSEEKRQLLFLKIQAKVKTTSTQPTHKQNSHDKVCGKFVIAFFKI